MGNDSRTYDYPVCESWEHVMMADKYYYQYDYRTSGGRLFSTVRPTLKQCREARDKWLTWLKRGGRR